MGAFGKAKQTLRPPFSGRPYESQRGPFLAQTAQMQRVPWRHCGVFGRRLACWARLRV